MREIGRIIKENNREHLYDYYLSLGYSHKVAACLALFTYGERRYEPFSMDYLYDALCKSKEGINHLGERLPECYDPDKDPEDEDLLEEYIFDEDALDETGAPDDSDAPDPAGRSSFSRLKEMLVEVLDTLTEREQNVLKFRYGLEDGRNRSQEEVGKQFGITRGRVRQIEAKALRKMRHPGRTSKLREYLEMDESVQCTAPMHSITNGISSSYEPELASLGAGVEFFCDHSLSEESYQMAFSAPPLCSGFNARPTMMDLAGAVGFATDEYEPIEEKEARSTIAEPTSTFRMTTNTASAGVIFNQLRNDRRIDRSMVRIEEMLNYFRYDSQVPKDEMFNITYELMDKGDELKAAGDTHGAPGTCTDQDPYGAPDNNDTHGAPGTCADQDLHGAPDNNDAPNVHNGYEDKSAHGAPDNKKYLYINVQGREEVKDRQNIIILLDVSGSMCGNTEETQAVIATIVSKLGNGDKLSLVTYSGIDRVELEAFTVNGPEDRVRVLEKLLSIEVDGCTFGSRGIERAYKVGRKNYIPGGNNQVILITDGDLNFGITDKGGLEELIERKKKDNLFLSVIGTGLYNYRDDKLETLSKHGNGVYRVVNNLADVKKSIDEEYSSLVNIIAKDVKAQVEFNPEVVESYRLLGFENRTLAREDFTNDKVISEPFGSGGYGVALYELKMKTGTAPAESGLKYSKIITTGSGELGTVKIRYKEPLEDVSHELEKVIETAETSYTDNFHGADASCENDLRSADASYADTFRTEKTSYTDNLRLAFIIYVCAEKLRGSDKISDVEFYLAKKLYKKLGSSIREKNSADLFKLEGILEKSKNV